MVARFTISLNSELAAEIQQAVQAASSSTSAWLAEAARRQLAADVVDASVVIAAARFATTGDVAILTSDKKDIGHLVETLQTSVTVVSV
jgi:metal-responsive CopG/Arc/MetJ family transcriptional regulator